MIEVFECAECEDEFPIGVVKLTKDQVKVCPECYDALCNEWERYGLGEDSCER